MSADPETAGPSRNERALRYMFSEVGIVRHLQLELVEWGPEHALVSMPFSERTDNGSGTPLGGAVATLVDIAGAAAVWAGHDFSLGGKHATVGLSIDFIGSGGHDTLLAAATVKRRHRDLTFVGIEVHSARRRYVASALMTFRIVR